MGVISGRPPACPKCGGRGTKYGKTWRHGEKYQRYQCTSCGHIYVGEPLEPVTIRWRAA